MAMTRRIVFLLLAALLVLGTCAAIAGAKKKHKKKTRKWDSDITLTHPSDSQFDGVVGSKFDSCRDSRVVTLFYTDAITGQTQPLSVQRTTSKGVYQIGLPQPAYGGTYHSEVAEGNVRVKKVDNTCKAASSPSIIVQGPPLSP